MNIFGTTGQERRAWLNKKSEGAYNALRYYAGPTGIPDKLNAVAELLQFTDAGDVYEAQAGAEDMRNAETVWDAIGGAGRMATGITAAAVPVVGAKMANNLTDAGIDWLGSAVDDVMAGYDPNQLNANFRAFHGTTRPFSRFSSDATRFPEDNGAVFFTSERGIAEGFADGDGAPRILEAEFDLNDPLMVRAADGQTPIETWDYSNGSLAAQAKAAGKDGVIIEGPSGERMFAVFDANGINIIAENGKPINPATTRGQEILDLLSTNPSAVTDDMLDMGDPVLNARLNEYLWNNYDLPMDEASRMARAEGMGYNGPAGKLTVRSGANSTEMPGSSPGPASTRNPSDIFGVDSAGISVGDVPAGGPDFYHGTTEDVVAFDGGRFGSNAGSWSGEGVYTTPDALEAEEYGNVILPLLSRGQNPNRQILRDYNWSAPDGYSQHLADQGYDATEMWVRDIDDRTGEIADEWLKERVDFDPANIRSRFARFDPRLAHLRNLNAGLAGLGLGAMGLTPSEEAEIEAYLGGI